MEYAVAYKVMDSRILTVLRHAAGEPLRFCRLASQYSSAARAAEAMYTVLGRSQSAEPERVLDRRLQGLKRAGTITYLLRRQGGPGWVLSD